VTRVYPSKQQVSQGLNQFQNFSAAVAPLVVRTKYPFKWKLWNNTCCEISWFLKTMAKNLGVRDLKVGGPGSPGPYGCCAYAWRWDYEPRALSDV